MPQGVTTKLQDLKSKGRQTIQEHGLATLPSLKLEELSIAVLI